MGDKTFLSWPFFDDAHRTLAAAVEQFAEEQIGHSGFLDHENVNAECADLLRKLAEAGLTRFSAIDPSAEGARLDVRSICLIRETLAQYSGLADFVFAMQGLGSGAISLYGSQAQKEQYLNHVISGRKVAAFALTEPEAGSDVANLAMTAVKEGDAYRLNGVKTFISNGGIADFYVVFVRTDDAVGAKGISAFIVDADTDGLDASERIETIAPHPLATVKFDDCLVDRSSLIGGEGEGFRIAMSVLDVFRSSVGAASLGFARRALQEAAKRSMSRELFGAPLSEMQVTQTKLADMALGIDTSALLIYRAAWTKDMGAPRVSREASMAKLHATETAQQTIDAAVQLFGGRGVTKGETVEALYREIRALRIYEGASEVHKLIIARHALDELKN